ncbi:MAG: nucleotidyl transferase AbiEii/AbiGii toxin family protein [Cyclobacteriaceae bacterium]|nr:nucleotidyl transferase AbiEii/AbiGii toxin family protein [Cyclobacteriaceae bacterium]
MSEKINLKNPLPGVSKNTYKVLKRISNYPELALYYLVGGTALAIRSQTCLSEDLDFFFYNQYPGKKQPLPKIKNILERLSIDFNEFEVINGDLKFDITCIVNEIKLDFHSENNFHPSKHYDFLGNIKLPGEYSVLWQ